tara:strand:+ start:418 stop:1695 length:1278 start_codon:yes stop_codon:yes gene_type:complete
LKISHKSHLKNFLIFFTGLIIFYLPSLHSQTTFITLSVSTSGQTEEMAINNALLESLSQINGTVINGSLSVQEFEKVSASNKSEDYFYSENYSRDINKYTEGIVESYKLVNSNPLNSGGWEVEVSVTIAKYALSPQTNRKRIAVMPFRITDTRELTVKNKKVDKRRILGLLNQSLVAYLTQSRKFFVADRDFVEELHSERNFIQYGNVPLSELSKLGNDLGVDLILVGVIEDFNTKSTNKSFESMNKTFVSTKGIVEISYRVIDVATRQVKFADLYLSDSGTTSTNADTQMITDAVGEIGETILFAIYPLRVEKIDGQTIYIGQGGNQLDVGDEYDVFRLGEQIEDSYTGESLGQVEEFVGIAKIENVTSKMSSAKVYLAEDSFLDESDDYVLRNKKKQIENLVTVSDKIKERKEKKNEQKDEIW